MKRLISYVLVALLSLGVASVSIAQQGAPTGGQEAAQQGTKAPKKHKKKHHKKGKKGKKQEGQAEEAK